MYQSLTDHAESVENILPNSFRVDGVKRLGSKWHKRVENVIEFLTLTCEEFRKFPARKFCVRKIFDVKKEEKLYTKDFRVREFSALYDRSVAGFSELTRSKLHGIGFQDKNNLGKTVWLIQTQWEGNYTESVLHL